VAVELKEGQEVTISCAADAKFSDSVIPVSCGSLQEIGLAAGSEIFVGQYLFTGSENTSAFLTAKEVRRPQIHVLNGRQCRICRQGATREARDAVCSGTGMPTRTLQWA